MCLGYTKCYGQSQKSKGPTAAFSFNGKSFADVVNGCSAKLVNIKFVDDRFGNDNNAVLLFGNEYSYINLGTYKALKPKIGTISLWMTVGGNVWSGTGY